MYAIVNKGIAVKASKNAVLTQINSGAVAFSPDYVFKIMSEESLNSYGVYKIVENKPELAEDGSQRYGAASLYYDNLTNSVVADYPIEDVPIDEIKNKLKRQLAASRYEVEVGGLRIDELGIDVQTDRESRDNFTPMFVVASSDPTFTVDWKVDGGWVQLSASQVMSIGMGVFSHVNQVFTKEFEIDSAITQATTISELNSIDVSVEAFNGNSSPS